MRFYPVYIFIGLSALFLIYTLSIYLEPLYNRDKISFDSKKAADGRLVWQNNNCQACHQLYGLGGYLGPDLSNVTSDLTKTREVLSILIRSGVKQMPAFKLNDKEMDQLMEFLESVNASGIADPRQFNSTSFGMIKAK